MYITTFVRSGIQLVYQTPRVFTRLKLCFKDGDCLHRRSLDRPVSLAGEDLGHHIAGSSYADILMRCRFLQLYQAGKFLPRLQRNTAVSLRNAHVG